MRELVDEQDGGPARERRVDVELGDACVRDDRLAPGKLRQALEQARGFRAAVRLDEADDDVDALLAQAARGREHRIGLADARRGAEEHLQPTAPAAGFLLLDAREQRVGIGTAVGSF